MSAMVFIDTGPLVALLWAKDQHHSLASNLSKMLAPPFFTTWPVITEALWLLREAPAATAALFHASKVGLLEVVSLDQSDLAWIGTFMKKYKQIKAQCADASLCLLAERTPSSRVFTFDYRDFAIYRIHTRKEVPLVRGA